MSNNTFLSNVILPYVAPFVAFAVLTEIGNFVPPEFAFFFYGLKVSLVALLLFYYYRQDREIFSGYFDLLSVVVGLVGAVLWIVLVECFGGGTSIYDPTGDIVGGYEAAIALRLAGAVVIVPAMEEIFWRGFLMRFLVDSNFEKVEIGKYSHYSFWLTVLCFCLVHEIPSELVASAVIATLYGYYFVRTKNLRGTIVAHAVTNLSLGVYVIQYEAWYLW